MIKIEVTGNSIPEVADKLLAIGHSLYSKTVLPVANGGTGAQTAADFAIEMQDESVVSITPIKTEEVLLEVAKAAPVDPTLAPKSAEPAAGSDSPPTTKAPSSTPAPAASVSEDLEVVDLPIGKTPALDFNKDIRELALKLVSKRSKAALENILAHFGVARASLVEQERLPELLAMINEALGQ